MTEALATTPSLPTYTPEQIELIKRTVCPEDITDDEFALFLEVAERKGLDPFQRQIHAMRRDGRFVIHTGIDGYRLIAQRNGLSGIDDAVIEYAMEGDEFPVSATVTVYRRPLFGPDRVPMTAHQRDTYTATAAWSEYYPGDGEDGVMWRLRPRLLIGKTAEALALRKGFQELGGIYADVELDRQNKPQPAPAGGRAPAPRPANVTDGRRASNSHVRPALPAAEQRGNQTGVGVERHPVGSLGHLRLVCGYETMEAANEAYAVAHEGVVPAPSELFRWLQVLVEDGRSAAEAP